MSFQDVAQNIIDNSIRSVLYIDDKIAKPFNNEFDRTSDNYKICSELHESFDKNNALVKYYKFENEELCCDQIDTILMSKDLLILDWKLSTSEPRYAASLNISKKAINTDSIFCVVIYTDTPEKDLTDIFQSICCYFCCTKPTRASKNLIEDKFGEYGLDANFVKDSLGDLKSLSIDKNNIRTIISIIRNEYKSYLEDNFEDFESFLQEIFETRNKVLTYQLLGYLFNDCIFSERENELPNIDIYGEGDNRYFKINNTFVFVERKIAPQQLYPRIKDAIISSTKNFLPIMGLELRNAFNNSSALISKEVSSIDEHAFLYHQDKIKPRSAFYEFLKDLWKDQSLHFLLSDNQIKIFSELVSYRRQKGIRKKDIEKRIKDGELDKDLGKLNCYYNVLDNLPNSREIRFGDIFRLKQQDNILDRYILCVTAHCDCLYPDKINNNFYFIEGSKDDIRNGLKEGDEGFNAFIEDKSNGEIICIKWKDKPITMHISDEQNNIGNEIQLQIGPNNYTAVYQVTLKENYTQRMANKAFSYPFHVGIYFADKKPKKKNK